MIFQNKTNRRDKENFLSYEDNTIENVSEFKFLGNIIKNTGNLIPSSDDLAKKARKVMYSIKSYTSLLVYTDILAAEP